MNDIELNAVLYYADFLSLKQVCLPVTDNCKYFFVHGAPINSLYILDLEPIYDETNEYFLQAKTEYEIIKNKFGEEGIESFIDDICSIKACGSVNAEQMLKCIHLFSTKYDRNIALKKYRMWLNNQKYTHIIIDDDGKSREVECTKYAYHVERMLERSIVAKGVRNNPQKHKIQA